MGACGAKPRFTPRFSHGATFRFWSFSRVETSGGIRASLAGRYASALFDLARDAAADRIGRPSLDALEPGAARFEGFRASSSTSPLCRARKPARRFAALAPQLGLDPITTNFLGVLAERPQEPASQRHPRVPPPRRRASRRDHRRSRHRPPARTTTRSPRSSSSFAPAPAATSPSTRRSIPTSSAGSSSSWAASRSTPRSAPNSTVSHHAMKG